MSFHLLTHWLWSLPAACCSVPPPRPDLVDLSKLTKSNANYNLQRAFRTAEQHLGLARLLDPEGEPHRSRLNPFQLHCKNIPISPSTTPEPSHSKSHLTSPSLPRLHPSAFPACIFLSPSSVTPLPCPTGNLLLFTFDSIPKPHFLSSPSFKPNALSSPQSCLHR